MFYAHFVLSKKGPLAKVWLAAHWERKLTKTHVYETNIEETVENLLNPKVKLALRTSGHLLLGVVRIHSRKAKYLLQDCNEALSKIKQAFRPVPIDMAPEQRVVNKTVITLAVQEKEIVPRELTMIEIDFDMNLQDLTDAEIQRGFSMNRSRPDEITLKENIIGRAKEIDDKLIDDFGGFGVEDFFTHMDEGPTILPVVDQDGPAEDAEAPPPPAVDVDGRNGPVLPNEEATAKEKADVLINEMAMDDNGPPDFGGGDMSPDAPPQVDNGPLALPSAEVPPLVEVEAPIPAETAVANGDRERTPEDTGVHDNTTLINPTEGFALAPRETMRPAKENARAKRKRKLIVDKETVISSDRMRQQLQDCSDIVRSLDMAPSTARLMYLREINGIDKLWNKPGMYYDDGVPGMSSKLTDLFMQQLAPAVPQGEEEPDDFFPATLGDDLMSSIIRCSNQMLDSEHANEIGGPDVGEMLDIHTNAVVPEMHMPFMPEDPYPVDVEPVPSPGKRNKRAHNAVESPAGADDTPRPTKRRAGAEAEDEEGSVNGDPEEEPHPEDHDKMSRRTKQVLDQFSGLLARRHTPRHGNPDGSQSVNFEDLTRGHRTRKEVAQRFYSTLVLKKLQVIDVEQEKPYGDIWLKKGGRYEEFAV